MSSENLNEVKDDIKNDIIGVIYQIGDVLDSGTFGELRLGINLNSKTSVAIKVESKTLNPPQLELENKIYQTLGKKIGVPKVYYYGNLEKYNVLVMDLLGNTLDEMFQLMKMKFQLKTIGQLAIQMLDRIEYIHSKGIIYRDIKPQNFLMGMFKSNDQNIVHLIDYGLAKSYINPLTNKHIPFKKHKYLTGTARFMSSNAHSRLEQSRRDDLQSIGYVLVYFCKGSLPWQGVASNSLKDKHQQIAKLKKMISNEDLCSNLPNNILTYMNIVKNLEFEETPDYNKLRKLFIDLLHSLNVSELNQDFEWNVVLEETLRKHNIIEHDKVSLKTDYSIENNSNRLINEPITSNDMNQLNKVKKKSYRTISNTRLKDAEIQ